MSRFNYSPLAGGDRFNFLRHASPQLGGETLSLSTFAAVVLAAKPQAARTFGSPTFAPVDSATSTVGGVQHYNSLIELSDLLKQVEDSADGLAAAARSVRAPIAVVVALPENFAGQAAPLIRRRRLGGRLLLTVASGELRLPDWSFIDDSRIVGWEQVQVEPDWRTAVRAAYHAVGASGRVVVCWPGWGEQAALTGELESLVASVDAGQA